ncbi:hypothetical protein M404DRAFT_109671, partial [Pisolithus tinctorius Marx 270]
PGICHFIWEHAVDMHRVMLRTFSGMKSQICQPCVIILGQACHPHGHSPDDHKVKKVV